MTKSLNFLVATVYKSLMIIGKREASIAESVSIRVSSVVVFFLVDTIASLLLMKLISIGALAFSKSVYLTVTIFLAVLLYFVLKKKYQGTVEQVVIEYEERFNLKNWQVITFFFLFWLGSLFIFWWSLLYFRDVWYGK